MRMLTKAVALFGFLIATPLYGATAHETGMSGMHTQAAFGNRICMTDHTHDGKGTGPSEREARISAANAWSSFTEWEYGPAWSSYALSNSKRENCQNDGSGYTCYFVSYPCKSRGGRLAAMPAAKPKSAFAPKPVTQRASARPSRPAAKRVTAPKPKAVGQKRQRTAIIQTNKKRSAKPAPAFKAALWTDAAFQMTTASR
jgi:hypothetical protein